MGHKPYSELTKDWPEERKARVEAAGKKLIAEMEGFSAIYETAVGMFKAGVIDEETMQEFAAICAKNGFEECDFDELW
jgi:hypothetical protein